MTETKDKPVKINMPVRYRKAQYHVIPDALDNDFCKAMGQWLFHNRRHMSWADGYHVAASIDSDCEHIHKIRARLVEALPEALEPCGVADFDLQFTEVRATLYHHGCQSDWHDDSVGHDGTFAATRRLAFAYYMHTDKQMFQGGQLEFLDGTLMDPDNGKLVLFHPFQRHRVRIVECWSAQAVHGRWALSGWLHGQPPEGYEPPAGVDAATD